MPSHNTRQTSFFDVSDHDGNKSVAVAKKLSRADEKSSELAAQKLVSSGAMHKHAMIALAIVRKWPDKTAGEIDELAQRLYELEGRQASKRLAGIAGMVSSKELRPCSIGGNKCKTWRFTGGEN